MPEGIQTVAKFITDYGLMILISAIFIYVVIKFIGIGFKFLETKFTTKRHDQMLDIRSEINKQVQRLITSELRKSDATRIHVIEFSNSVMSVAYLPFKYMTCTYEVHKLGVSSTGHKIDKLSTSLFTPFFTELNEHEYCIFNIDDPHTTMGGAMCDLMEAQDEHQALCVAMKTPRGKHIGYVEMIKEDEFTGTDIDDMQHLSQQISALLSIAESKQN